MSPQLLAMLQRIGRDTYRLHHTAGTKNGARYPRDYFTPCELVRERWHGNVGRYYFLLSR